MASEPTSSVFTSQRLKLHFVEWGSRNAASMVLLHGARDHCRSWDQVAQGLARRWRVIAPDMRGHGDSAWVSDGAYDMTSLVLDLSELIEQLGLGPARLVAHSLGGAVAVRLAALRPELVDRLATIEGLGHGRVVRSAEGEATVVSDLRRWMQQQRDIGRRAPPTYATIEGAAERLRRMNPRLTPAQADHLATHGLRRAGEGWVWKYDPAMRAMAADDITTEEVRLLWEAVACPVLMIYGGDSWATDPVVDGRIGHFRDARRVMVEGAGHWVHHDRLAEVLEALDAFL